MNRVMVQKIIYLIIVVLGINSLDLPLYADDDHTHDSAKKGNIELKMGWIMGAVPLKVKFVLKNNGEQIYLTTPIGTNRNRLIIQTPDEKIVEHFFWKDGIKAVEVEVNGEKSWEVALEPIFGHHNLNQAGFYEIFWYVDGHKSPKMYVYTNGK